VRNRRVKEEYLDYYKKGTEKKEEVHYKSLTFQDKILQCGAEERLEGTRLEKLIRGYFCKLDIF
jgi:hypothetical protein